MPIRVLVVDDSVFFRNQVVQIINAHPQLEAVGVAANGQEAIDQAIKLKPDVITMDYEMPVMDGISAVKEIMRKAPTAILMFSSLTTAGAKITLDALDAGAVDFLPKFREQMTGSTRLKEVLCQRILLVARKKSPQSTSVSAAPDHGLASSQLAALKTNRPDVLLVGASTGGPVALQKLVTGLPANFSVPIVLIQHMPGTFTGPFAERLNQLSRIGVRQASDGEQMVAGQAYLAPGGMQMMFSQRGRLKVMAGDERLNYKPSVDLTFGSAVKHYPGKILAIVLTGMGSDGRDGARLIKGARGKVWVQDAASCVIDGMPGSIRSAGLADAVMPIPEMVDALVKIFG